MHQILGRHICTITFFVSWYSGVAALGKKCMGQATTEEHTNTHRQANIHVNNQVGL